MRRPSLVPALATFAAGLILAACGDAGLLQSLVNPRTLELSGPVAAMVPGDRVETALIVRNRSDRTVRFHGGGCTFNIEVLAPDGSSLGRQWDDSSVPGGCAGYLAAWTVPPRDSLVVPLPWSGVSPRSPAPPHPLIGLPPGSTPRSSASTDRPPA
jgi:hypothetical protein